MTRAAIGIDVGGTFAKVAAVTPAAKILIQTQIPTDSRLGPAAFVGRIGRLLAAWRKDRGLSPAALGLGLAGDVDAEGGRLRFAPNLRSWEGFDFKRACQGRLGLGAIVDNDANLAVWGGYCVELKRRPRDVVGVTLGTGVGGGIVVDGRLYHGSTGSAGEVGHTLVEPGGALCHCGQRGCLEAYAGSYGIIRIAKRLLSESRARSSLRGGALDPARIAAAADRGDAVARRVWAITGRYLGIGLTNLVLVLNPEVVLLLGGVSRAGTWLLAPIREQLHRQPFRTPFGKLTLRAADNPDWGCVGAALRALDSSRR